MKLLADENFNFYIVRGLRSQVPHAALKAVVEVGLRTLADTDVLAWCAAEGYILLTHDRKTIEAPAYARVEAGLAMPGVFVISDHLPVSAVIEEISLIADCSTPEEWQNRVTFLPL